MANKKNSCCKLSDRKVCARTDGKRRTQYSCIQGPLTKCLVLSSVTENLFEFNGNNYLQTHGVALGIKTAVSFANIYKAETETNLIQHRNTNENVSLMTFPFFGTVTEKTQLFIKETNKTHPKNEVHGRNMK